MKKLILFIIICASLSLQAARAPIIVDTMREGSMAVDRVELDPSEFINRRMPKPVATQGSDITPSIQLDTTGSKLIDQGVTCHFIDAHVQGPSTPGKLGAYRVQAQLTCSDGTIFKNFEQKEGSSTGTPLHLQYPDTFIGSYIKQDASGLPGSGIRVYFLKK